MAVLTGYPAPYAPARAVLSVVERFRERGLTTPFTLDVLTRAGVSESLAPRTLQSLKILDLIDDAGNPTPTLEGLRRAPSSEYQTRLQEFLRGAYPEVFGFVDPATDSEDRIRDAFRLYEPHGQQVRMVSLFMGLAEAAGFRAPAENGDGTERPAQQPRARTPRPAGAPRRTRAGGASGANGRGGAPPPSPPPPTMVNANPPSPPAGGGAPGGASDLPPALVGLMATLPKEGAPNWSAQQKGRFVAAFTAVIDLLYPTTEEGQ